MPKKTKKLTLKNPKRQPDRSAAHQQSAPNIERRSIRNLASHPLQDEYFSQLPDDQLQLLADSLMHNGQVKPIIIMEDGTVLSGHQTLRAAEQIGWKEVDVNVRRDITDPLSEAAMAIFMDTNLAQRALSPLEAARILRFKSASRKGKRAGNGEGELRDAIARKIGMTGRNLDRYVRLLDAPPEIQGAVVRNQLPLQWALRVLGMSPKQQKRVVAAVKSDVAASKDGRKAAVELIKRLTEDASQQAPAKRHQRPTDALQQLRAVVEVVLAGGAEIARQATQDDVHAVRQMYRLLKEQSAGETA